MRESESPEDDTNHYNTEEFDLCMNFSEFLEEARYHSAESNFKSTSVYPDEVENGGRYTEKKSKKSWKNSLFSWLKGDKKRNPPVKQESNAPITSTRRCRVSGPIYGHVKETDRSYRRSESGHLTGLFNPRSLETEIPFMCLDQLDNPHTYGPVYLVT